MYETQRGSSSKVIGDILIRINIKLEALSFKLEDIEKRLNRLESKK